jgi:hypothetical protein
MEQDSQRAGEQRANTENQGDEQKDGNPLIERQGQPSSGSERLWHMPFDPRGMDFIIEPRNFLQHAGGEQPDWVGLTSLDTVQKHLDVAGRAFDKTDAVTVDEPIVTIAIRFFTEATETREEPAVQNDTQFLSELPPV